MTRVVKVSALGLFFLALSGAFAWARHRRQEIGASKERSRTSRS
jgi:hypothetical protein